QSDCNFSVSFRSMYLHWQHIKILTAINNDEMLVTETETMSNKRVTTTTRPMIYVIHRDMIIDKTATGMSRLIGTETVGEMMTPVIRVKMVTMPAIMGRTVTKSPRKPQIALRMRSMKSIMPMF